jgi:hypothetical protein
LIYSTSAEMHCHAIMIHINYIKIFVGL